MKKLMALVLAMVLTFALAVPAGAVETKTPDASKEVGVILNGKAVEFPANATPEIKSGNTMVPVRTIVEAMGGTLSMDKTGLITCQVGSTQLIFRAGESTVEVNTAGNPVETKADGQSTTVVANGGAVVTTPDGTSQSKTETVKLGVLIYSQSGATYVPVGLFRDALGYDVLWDKESRSAVLIDNQTLIDEINKSFTVMNSAMEKNYSDPTKNYKSTATYDITMNIPAQKEGEPAVNGTMKMTMDMISSATAVEMKGTLDASMLAPLLDLDGAVKDGTIPAAEAAAVRKALSNSTFQIRFDMKTGDLYMNLGMLSALTNGQIPAETWMKLSIKDMLAGVNLSDLLDMQSGKQTIGDLIYTIARADAVTSVGGNAKLYDTVKTATDVAATFLGDKSAKQSAGSYQFHLDSAAINAKVGGDIMGDVFDAFVLDITVNGGTITCKFDMKTSTGTMQGQPDMTLGLSGSMTMSADKSSVTMNLDMGKLGTAKYVLAVTMTPTTQQPVTAPPAGANVMDLNEMLNSASTQMPATPTVPAVPAA